MVDKLAINARDRDAEREQEIYEMDDYIDHLEERIGEAEERLEANDQYIDKMHEQLEEY